MKIDYEKYYVELYWMSASNGNVYKRQEIYIQEVNMRKVIF